MSVEVGLDNRDEIVECGAALGGAGGDDGPDALGPLTSAFTCRVWNAFGEDISTSATLTVNAVPVIREQPLSRTVDQWQDVCFWINATGSTPLHYQWIHDGVDIPGSTSIAHGIIRVQPRHEGELPMPRVERVRRGGV